MAEQAKQMPYSRVSISNKELNSRLASVLGCNEGDIVQMVMDGKIVPVVILGNVSVAVEPEVLSMTAKDLGPDTEYQFNFTGRVIKHR